MIDDLDRCECVNVSFGTGSPGLSQTIQRAAHHARVCVRVCDMDDNVVEM